MNAFFRFLQRILVQALEANQETAAPAARCQVKQLVVPCNRGRRETAPANLQRDQRGEEFFGVRHVSDQIQIEENHAFRAHLFDIRHHVRHWFLQRPAPCEWHNAKIALINASTCCLKSVSHVHEALVEKLALRKRKIVQLQAFALVIAALHPSRNQIAQQLWPRLFRVSHHDAIGVVHRFFGHQRGMDSAERDGNVTISQARAQFRRRGERFR